MNKPKRKRRQTDPETAARVIAIRERAHSGVPLADLARRYGMSCRNVRKLVFGTTYWDVGGPLRKPRPYKRRPKADAKSAQAVVASTAPPPPPPERWPGMLDPVSNAPYCYPVALTRQWRAAGLLPLESE